MSDKKICLIEPPISFLRELEEPPFPLMYLAAIAEQSGWQAEIIHMRHLKDKLPDADVYGVTSSSPQFPDTILLSLRLMQEFPDKLRILGGAHISACPDDHYKTAFDASVVGEGEWALTAILRELKYFRKGGGRILQGQPVQNLDLVPFPARHLINWSDYTLAIHRGKKSLGPAVSIITSRGCPYNCIFCGSHCVFGRQVRFRSVENVVAEIREVIDTLGYHGFVFRDDTFCVNQKRVLALCREFINLDIVWRCLTRVDTVNREVLAAMRDGGCQEVILGIESGDQGVLNNLRKGVTVEQNRTAMKLVKEFMQLKVGLIVGSPGETWDTVKATENLVRECPPDFWNVSTFTPLPGSDAWNTPEKFGLKIITRDLRRYRMMGKDMKGNVVVETKEMSKSDLEQARDYLIDVCTSVSGRKYDL